MDWHWCKKCHEVVKSCPHNQDFEEDIKVSDNTGGTDEDNRRDRGK